jgi:hypothetical protein
VLFRSSQAFIDDWQKNVPTGWTTLYFKDGSSYAPSNWVVPQKSNGISSSAIGADWIWSGQDGKKFEGPSNISGPFTDPNDGSIHYYEYIKSTNTFVTWEQAKEAAEKKEYNGYQGYLATSTSDAEDLYIYNLMMSYGDSRSYLGGTDDYELINNIQASSSNPSPVRYNNQQESEGLWTWATGPEAGKIFTQTPIQENNMAETNIGYMYQNWSSLGYREPNDLNHSGLPGVGQENILVLISRSIRSWNDVLITQLGNNGV